MANRAEPLSAGRGVQVVTPEEGHSFSLNEEALRRLLLRPDVKELPVVVISVAGAFRKGKSFLLDFFLRYLHHTYSIGASGDWLGEEDQPLQGFAWRGGSERETTGLHLWSQPFFANLHTGEKVVILLMDTQGTFDSESTVRDNATVFALSTMLSSVQIYNLSQNIEEDDLQHLQLFTDYGRLASSESDKPSSRKPFQRLQFLLRDWSYPYEYQYGAAGGQRLLEKRLEVMFQLFTDYGRLASSESDKPSSRKPFQRLQFLLRDWSYPYEYQYGAAGGQRLLEKRLEVMYQLFTDYGRLASSESDKPSSRKPFQRLQFLLRDWSYPYEYQYGAAGGQRLLEKRLEVMFQLFTDYGRLASSESDKPSSRKPFQRLQFLLRDWSYPYEYQYGAAGGQRLLEKRLEVHEGQHESLQGLRRHITSCFEQLACFLLPHPGMKVATHPDFNGNLSDIDGEFLASLRELVPLILAPQHLVPKLIEGETVKAKDLLIYFNAYMNVFNGTELPEPKSILAATAEANNLSALAAARDVYDALMEEVCGGARPYLQPARLLLEHRRVRDKAVLRFHAARKMGGDDLANTYCEKLIAELEEEYKRLSDANEGKNIFKFIGTPAVFCTLIILGYILSLVGGALGVQTVVAAGQGIAVAAVVMLVLWIYTRTTGNMHDIGMQLDDFANTTRNYVVTQVWDTYGQRAAMTAAGLTTDNKKNT